MNQIKTILLLAVVSLLTACSTMKTDELTSEESLVLSDKTLVYTQYYETPSFAAQTPVNVQFGLIGLAMARSNGNEMIASNGIEDPAIGIAKELAAGLNDSYNLELVHADISTRTDDLNEIIKLYSQYDYILDVRTLGWMSIYYATDWNNYQVVYQVLARLIDRDSGAVIAQEMCLSAPVYEDLDLAPSYAELESGSRLQTELDKNAAACVDYIRKTAKLYDAKDSVVVVSDRSDEEDENYL